MFAYIFVGSVERHKFREEFRALLFQIPIAYYCVVVVMAFLTRLCTLQGFNFINFLGNGTHVHHSVRSRGVSVAEENCHLRLHSQGREAYGASKILFFVVSSCHDAIQ